MKNETNSTLVESATSKQAWTEPTLTNLSVSLETHAMGTAGGDASTLAT